MEYALLCRTEKFELTYNSTTFGQDIPKGRTSIAFNYLLFTQTFMVACELSFNRRIFTKNRPRMMHIEGFYELEQCKNSRTRLEEESMDKLTFYSDGSVKDMGKDTVSMAFGVVLRKANNQYRDILGGRTDGPRPQRQSWSACWQRSCSAPETETFRCLATMQPWCRTSGRW